MNGTIFSRLVEIIDEERGDEDRKIFIVIDEFPTISGDDTPCPGMKAFFTRLRKRKTTLFLTYQGHSTVKSVYGDEAGGLVGQCHSAIYLRQPDDEQSVMEAEKSLGYKEREKTRGSTRGEKDVSRNVQEGYNKTPYCSATKLAQLPPASKEAGITGWLKSGARKEQEPHPFYIGPELVDNNIPITDKKLFKEYERRDGHEEEIAPLRDVERKTLMSDVPVVPPEFQDP